jgi:hypothetical protein
MRLSFLFSLTATALIGGTYWYKSTENICPVPITYRVGSIDPAFNLTEAAVKGHLSVAESVWESAAGRDLFVYDEASEFAVDFVFDERQASADSEFMQRQALDEKKAEHEMVFSTVETMQAQYQEISQGYQRRLDTYESNLTRYNNTVRTYNDQGGAPAEEFDQLQKDKRSLDRESSELSKQSDEINALAKEIGELSERGNQLVDSYNREVNEYNKQFGFTREFTQGDFTSERISIYKFSDTKELVTVLTHEFGHALGIGHVDGSSSVMYYLLENTSEVPVLSEQDLAAFAAACGDESSLAQRIRLAIRKFI